MGSRGSVFNVGHHLGHHVASGRRYGRYRDFGQLQPSGAHNGPDRGRDGYLQLWRDIGHHSVISQIPITQDTVIEGGNLVKIDGGLVTRFFDIPGSQTSLTLKDIILASGYSREAGAATAEPSGARGR